MKGFKRCLAGGVVFGALAAEGQWTVSSLPGLDPGGPSAAGWGGAPRGLLTESIPGNRFESGLPWVPRPEVAVGLDRRGLALDEVRALHRARSAGDGALRDAVVRMAGVALDALAGDARTLDGPGLALESEPGPFSIDVGTVVLQPNQADQWVTFQVRNQSAGPVELAGFNFSLQVGDSGPASEGGLGTVDGPNIQSVELGVGTLFAGNNTGTVSGARPAQAGQWSITTASGSVVLGAGALVPIAHVRISTVGFTASDGSWPLSLTLDLPGEGLTGLTTLVSGLGAEWAVQSGTGTLQIVPEPGRVSVVVAGFLVALGAFRRGRRTAVGG